MDMDLMNGDDFGIEQEDSYAGQTVVLVKKKEPMFLLRSRSKSWALNTEF